jgi:hypothetical protein
MARTKPTYIPIDTDGGPMAPVAYTPLPVTVGGVTHTLALHKALGGIWVVADPVSGALVVERLRGPYGTLVSTRTALSIVTPLALAAVNNLVARIGPRRFNDTLAGAARRRCHNCPRRCPSAEVESSTC